jgi:ribonuclease P/MRP protein subunit POP1
MASNPAKRKPFSASGPHGATGAARKRAKTFDARTLAVQSTDAALSATGELDVAAYAAARAFEIQALEEGMQRSKNALTTRAFQKVPRSLRRRTASHNVKRVPRRLRARAQREVSPFRALNRQLNAQVADEEDRWSRITPLRSLHGVANPAR